MEVQKDMAMEIDLITKKSHQKRTRPPAAFHLLPFLSMIPVLGTSFVSISAPCAQNPSTTRSRFRVGRACVVHVCHRLMNDPTSRTPAYPTGFKDFSALSKNAKRSTPWATVG
jgi:hypothetical protein